MSIRLASTSMRSIRAVTNACWRVAGNSDQLFPMSSARAISLQARRPTRGISHRPTQTAALFAAQHGQQGRPPRPRDPPALHQKDRPCSRRRAANPILSQPPSRSRGLRDVMLGYFVNAEKYDRNKRMEKPLCLSYIPNLTPFARANAQSQLSRG